MAVRISFLTLKEEDNSAAAPPERRPESADLGRLGKPSPWLAEGCPDSLA